MLESIGKIIVKVKIYGSNHQLEQLARSEYDDLEENIIITPWDKLTNKYITKALKKASLICHDNGKIVTVPIDGNEVILSAIKNSFDKINKLKEDFLHDERMGYLEEALNFDKVPRWAHKLKAVAKSVRDDGLEMKNAEERDEENCYWQMYLDDASDLETVLNLMLAGKLKEAAKKAAYMDTAAREYIPTEAWDILSAHY